MHVLDLTLICKGKDAKESIASDLRKLAGVMKDNNSLIGALKDSAKIAVSGRRYMDDVKYSGHFVIEERTKEAAIFACEEVNRICEQYGGSKIESRVFQDIALESLYSIE